MFIRGVLRGLAITIILVIFGNLLAAAGTYEFTLWHGAFLGAAGGVLGVERP